jgi:hypothetical protein
VKLTIGGSGVDVPGASATVNTSGQTAGQFAYVGLPSPVALAASTQYFLSSLEASGGDTWCDLNTKLTTTNAATCNGAEFLFGTTWTPEGVAGNSYVPVSFTYQASAPAGPTSWVTAVTAGAVRNNYSSFVGLAFTTGTSPISVYQLGRWVLSGNSASHTVKLTLASSGVDVAGGSVSVSTSGQTAGQFAYASLPSQIALPASTKYYLTSLEVSGGDTWYDLNTTLTTTNAATCNSAEFYYTTGTEWLAEGTGGNSYGPVGFTYE